MVNFSIAALLAVASPLVGAVNVYDTEFTGEGTFYGPQPSGQGNCALTQPIPDIYDLGPDYIPIALNHEQYDGSLMCGACIEGEFTGEGLGVFNPEEGQEFRGYVSDRCPECKKGDLDFGMSGDGRWNIKWKFVDCERGGSPTFRFEGSNPWYWKIQPRGMVRPPKKVTINGATATRSQDNHFVYHSGEPLHEATVRVKMLNKKKKYNMVVTLNNA
ncbi:unnamed protein product [Discosporangium mesarthrocarpum]